MPPCPPAHFFPGPGSWDNELVTSLRMQYSLLRYLASEADANQISLSRFGCTMMKILVREPLIS